MTIQEDELFKATAHGLVIGCTLPILGYNIAVKNTRNVNIYFIFLAFEVYNVVGHLRKAAKEKA